MIRTDFNSLNIPGVEIFFDELAKVDVINYINKQNFNKTDYLKKDYLNFKKYIQVESYPTHVDYINSDIAPDLIRFMKSKINGKKNKSYYSFLKKINEDNIPIFTSEENELIDKISEMLPIVRCDEILILKSLLESNTIDTEKILGYNSKININTINHAIMLLKKDGILDNDNKINIELLSDDMKVYLADLFDYALLKYEIDFGDFDGTFKVMANYYKEQIMRVLLENALTFMKGTKFNDDGTTYVFVGLKKDSSKEEKLNYKDKFISSKVFQWESENNTTLENSTGKKLLNTKVVHLFVRKMDEQDGITLPFTYFGTGTFTNARKTKNNQCDTLTFDIVLDNEVSEEYYLDFEIPKGKDYE